MTGPDADAEPLRVPPWLAGNAPSSGRESAAGVPRAGASQGPTAPPPGNPAVPATTAPVAAPDGPAAASATPSGLAGATTAPDGPAGASATPSGLAAATTAPDGLAAASATPSGLAGATAAPDGLAAATTAPGGLAGAVPGTADEAVLWPAAPDRDGWHASAEPSQLRGLLAPWRPRLILAGVAAALSLLSILLVSATFGEDGHRAAPALAAPSRAGGSGPGPGVTGTDAAPASPSRPASPSPAVSSAVASAAAPTTAPPRSSTPVTFGPVTFEAEAPGNTLGGSAWADRYPGASGGSIVRNIGDWGSRDGAGYLRFQKVNVPVDGAYTLRLFHVNIDNERTRTAVVTVTGRDPQPVTLTGSSTCCTGAALKVQLRKGDNTITVSNPAGHAPSIDRIVLSLP